MLFRDAPLASVRDGSRRVAIDFDAAWCSACRELERDVLATPEGQAPFAGLETIRVDFDAEQSPPLIRRFAILELPTLVVLAPDRTEVGRVVGYDGRRAAWIEEAWIAVAADDPLPALRAALDRSPADLEARLALGGALLSRDPDAGQALLEGVAWSADPACAPEALFRLARYRHRCRRDPEGAAALWRELALRFPEHPHAAGAHDWYARAQSELGHLEVGSAAFAARVATHPRDLPTLLAWARYVGRHAHEPSRAAVRDAMLAALDRARGRDRDELERLVLELGRPLA